jgi:hypothetical protein
MFQEFHSADPLIFPLPKHFCGRVHCSDERWVFLLQTGVSFTNFFLLVWLKDWNNCFTLFKIINKLNAFSIPKYRCHDLSCWWNRPNFALQS